jgi:hypothetical protein
MSAPTTIDAPRHDSTNDRVATTRTALRPQRILPATRTVLVAFAVLTLLATNQLLVVASFTDRYFAWTISVRATSAFLGAAYAAGFLLAVFALRQDRWRDVRVAVVTVTVFTVLTLVPTLVHLHVFHLWEGGWGAQLVAWVWLAIYVAVPIAGLTVVVLQHRQSAEVAVACRPVPRWLGAVLAGQGLLLFGVGAAMFLGAAGVHHLPEDAMSFWPWRLMPLGAQVIGAWLLALAVATALVIAERDLNRMLVPAVTYTAFGVFQLGVALRYWSQIRPDYQWGWAYLALLVSIALTGAYGCWAAARRSCPTSR